MVPTVQSEGRLTPDLLTHSIQGPCHSPHSPAPVPDNTSTSRPPCTGVDVCQDVASAFQFSSIWRMPSAARIRAGLARSTMKLGCGAHCARARGFL